MLVYDKHLVLNMYGVNIKVKLVKFMIIFKQSARTRRQEFVGRRQWMGCYIDKVRTGLDCLRLCLH